MELVLSQPDRPSGRGLDVQFSRVKQFALKHHLVVEQPEKIRNNAELQDRLQRIAPEAIIIVAYGRLIPPWMLTLPRHGNLNLHASLLPKYRGAAPIQWAVANGETETGVTTMRIDEGLDTGNILLEQRVPILPDQTSVELSPILAAAGAALMVQTLAGLAAGTLRGKPQDHHPRDTRADSHTGRWPHRMDPAGRADLQPLAWVSALAGRIYFVPRKEAEPA